jgi:hypothetical protein
MRLNLRRALARLLGRSGGDTLVSLGVAGCGFRDGHDDERPAAMPPMLRDLQVPYPRNASGPFYSVNDGCITCGAPHVAAPDLMAWDADPSGTDHFTHCFFARQPSTPSEVERALAAMDVSCVQNLRYGGDDPAILGALSRMGYRHLCDVLCDR